MMPSLVGAADDNAMPTTEKYLFVGGPKHGQYKEVVKGDPMFKVIVPPTLSRMIAPEDVLSGNDGYEIHTYVKRDLGLREDDGTAYIRTVYVHEVIPSPDVAQQMLMAALMTEFVKGGRKVIEHESPSTGSAFGR